MFIKLICLDILRHDIPCECHMRTQDSCVVYCKFWASLAGISFSAKKIDGKRAVLMLRSGNEKMSYMQSSAISGSMYKMRKKYLRKFCTRANCIHMNLQNSRFICHLNGFITSDFMRNVTNGVYSASDRKKTSWLQIENR